MKRSALPLRAAPMARHVTLRKRNAKRAAMKYARNYGERGDAVRAMRCIILGVAGHRCRTPVEACHSDARGMGGVGGGRRDLFPGCSDAHREAGERPGPGRWEGTARAAFVARYGIDPQTEADRIALELDARGIP